MAKPNLIVEIDFTGNPTATMADVLNGSDDVVSFWRLNSTSTMLDERASNNDGVIEGTPTLTTGPYSYDTDQGLTFNGSSNAAYVVNSTSLETNGQMTVAFWLKVASLPGSTKDVVTKRGAWLFQLNSSGKLLFTLKDDTSTATVTSVTSVATGTWYHVVGVYTDTAINLYLNGVLDSTAAYSSGMGLDGQPIRLAAEQSSAAPAFGTFASSSGVSTAPGASKPASTASGDLLLAQISWIGVQTITAAPTGWTDVSSVTSTRSDRVYMKVAGGAEPASYAWTLSASVGWTCAISRFTGVDQVVPIAQAYGSSTAAGVNPIPTGTHLPNTNNNMVVAMFSRHDGATSFTESSGTERYDVAGGGALSGTIAMSTQTQTTATSISVTGTSSTSTNVGAAFMVVLNGAGRVWTACSLDDLAVYDAALDADDVLALYASRNSGTGTWVDVTADVDEVSFTSAKRQYELDKFEAGTATVVLRDQDRKYDPGNTAGPYYPLKPMRRIRIKSDNSGTVTSHFTGYVERWPAKWEGPMIANVHLAAVDGFDALAQAAVSGDLTIAFSGAQIDAVLNKALWPSSLRDLDTGAYVMAGDDSLSGTALSVIQEIADSELGVFFVDGSGNATFHDRSHRGSDTRSTTSQATFVDSGATGSQVPYDELEPSYDRDRIINEWAVSPHDSVAGGATQTVKDTTSIAQYFLRSQSRSTRLALNTDALAQGNQLLNETAQPSLRFDSLSTTPTTTAEFTTTLALRISDRVTVTRDPLGGVGTVITRDCFVEGFQWQIRPTEQWRLTLNLSSVSAGNYYDTIMRDVPVTYWRMDTIT